MSKVEDWEKIHGVPEYITALLESIESELDRVMWNINHEEYSNPFRNTGTSFKNDTFEVHAYDWNWDDDSRQDVNFKCGDLEISWYKYLGRSMSKNRPITEKEMVEIYQKCIDSLRAYGKEHDED